MTQADSLITDAALGHLTCSPTTQLAAAAASVMATPRCAPPLPGSRNTTSAQTSAMVIVQEACLPAGGSSAWQEISLWKLGWGQQQRFYHAPFAKMPCAPQPWWVGWERESPCTCCYPSAPSPTTSPPASSTSAARWHWSPLRQPPFTPKSISLLSISEFQLRLLAFIY